MVVTRQELCFVESRRAVVQERAVAEPGPGEARVETRFSALSVGTELSVYRGEIHEDLPLAAVPAGSGSPADSGFRFPLCYGYACVGRVSALGAGEGGPEFAVGDRVFAFHHHADRFNCSLSALRRLPEWLPDERALFLPNMETAVTMLLDATPRMGEVVGLWGAGTVGLLTLSLLLQHPLARVHVFEPNASARRQLARWLEALPGAGAELVSVHADPNAVPEPLDLAFELSSAAAALQSAIDHMQLEGRVVVGSWYGRRPVHLDLGRHFHRGRVQLISSQVSSLPGHLGPAWSFERRWAVVDAALRRIPAEVLIDARTSLAALPQHFVELDSGRSSARQLVVDYAEN